MKRHNVILESNVEPKDNNVLWLQGNKLKKFGNTGWENIVEGDVVTTDRIENGAVTSDKIATSAFDSTLSVSGKIAPADVVGEKLTELESEVGNVETLLSTNFETISLNTKGEGNPYYILQNNIWGSGGKSYIYPVSRGDKVVLKANANYNTYYALLSSPDIKDSRQACFLFGWYGRKLLSPNEEIVLDIPTDSFLYIYGNDSHNNVYFPGIAEIHRMPNNAINRLDDSVQSLNIHINKIVSSEIEINRENMMRNQGYISGNLVYIQSGYHRIYPVKQGDEITITSQDSNASFVALVDSNEFLFEWKFVGDSGRTCVVGQTELFAPKDCYLYVYETDTSGNDYFPQKISIAPHSDSIAESAQQVERLSNVINRVLSPIGGEYELSKINADAILKYYISSSNKWVQQGVLSALLFHVKKDSLVTMTAFSEMKTIYSLLTTSDIDYTKDVPFVNGWVRKEISAGQSETISIPQDCYLYIYYKTSKGQRYFPERVIYNNIESAILNPQLVEEELTYQNAYGFLRKGISSNALWNFQNVNTLSSVIWEVNKGDEVTITANDNYNSFYALLHDVTGTVNTTPNFIAGETGRHTIKAKQTESFIIPEKCFLYVYRQADSGNIVYYPSHITIKKSNLPISRDIQRTRFAVNLLNQNDVLLASTIDESGRVVEQLEYKCTPMIKLHHGSEWYQKVKYVHCCSLNTEVYAFRAVKVVFYDSLYNLISLVENVTSAIEIPEQAEYVRVVFDNSDDLLYVATDNRSTIQPYREYNPADLVRNPNNVYDSINNSDGAISQMIYTALTLMNRSNLGYGDIATAFDNVVEPVPSEFTPIKYEGEKMQINCSTFAQMCLMGITYDNSRYANPTGRNIGNLYKYDSMAEFNYRYTKDEFAHIEGADFGKMYANKMAKYAFDRGLLYHAKPDYSNIEVGDLLFNTAKFKLGNDRNFFWNIGHVSFVNEVLMNEDGSKTIIVMENGTIENEWKYGSAGIVGARFPLPIISIERKNVVKDFTPYNNSVSLTSEEAIILTSVNIDDTFRKNTLFTAVVDAEIPEGCDVVIYVDGKLKSKIHYNSYRRGDKLFIKHFHFYQNDNTDSKIMQIGVISRNSINDASIIINDVKLYNGYHRM